MNRFKADLVMPLLLALLVDFSVLAFGAYDLWSATTVHVVVMILSLGLLLAKCWAKNSQGVYLPLLPLVVLLGVSFYISFNGSVNPSESFIALMDWFTAVLLFYISCNVFRSEKAVRFFVGGVAPLFLIELPILIKQNALFVLNRGFQDPSGTLINANVFSGFQLMWIAPIWDRLQKKFSLRSKSSWIWGLVFIVWVLNFILARSVWSWVLFSLSFPFIAGRWWMKKLNPLHRKFWVIWGVVLLGALVLLGVKINLISHTGRDFYSRPYTNRIIWWESGLLMLKDSPWFGVGLGNFPSAYLAYKTGEGLNSLHSHSIVIKLLSETGIVGFLSILIFFFGWVGKIYKSKSEHFDRTPFVVGAVLFLMFTSVSIGIEFLANLVILSIFMGMTVCEENNAAWKPRKSVLIIIAGLAISFFPSMVMPFVANQLCVDGNALLSEKKLDLAEQSFRSAVSLDDRPWEAYWGLAQVAAARGNGPEALQFGEQALKRNKLNPHLRKNLEDIKRSFTTTP